MDATSVPSVGAPDDDPRSTSAATGPRARAQHGRYLHQHGRTLFTDATRGIPTSSSRRLQRTQQSASDRQTDPPRYSLCYASQQAQSDGRRTNVARDDGGGLAHRGGHAQIIYPVQCPARARTTGPRAIKRLSPTTPALGSLADTRPRLNHSDQLRYRSGRLRAAGYRGVTVPAPGSVVVRRQVSLACSRTTGELTMTKDALERVQAVRVVPFRQKPSKYPAQVLPMIEVPTAQHVKGGSFGSNRRCVPAWIV
ncbi:hypothetical protein C8Q80DRAFT_1925 [Daedaleopsis nitida]|nr:hypothetical protein C8Q80DRAFT_1925 [Daedaleopsis nitida]